MLNGLIDSLKSLVYTGNTEIIYGVGDYAPRAGGERFTLKLLPDNTLEVFRANCKEIFIAECKDYDQPQVFHYSDPKCDQISARCGPTVYEYYFDPMKHVRPLQDQVSNYTSSFYDSLQTQVSDYSSSFYESLQDRLSQYRTFFYDSLPDSQQIGHFFTDRVEQLNNGINYATNTMSSWFYGEPETQCNWDDYQCHYEKLSDKLNNCEDTQCYFSTLKDYLSQFDLGEIYQNISEEYLPEKNDAIMYSLLAVSTMAAVGTVAYSLYRRHQNAAKGNSKISEASSKKGGPDSIDIDPADILTVPPRNSMDG